MHNFIIDNNLINKFNLNVTNEININTPMKYEFKQMYNWGQYTDEAYKMNINLPKYELDNIPKFDYIGYKPTNSYITFYGTELSYSTAQHDETSNLKEENKFIQQLIDIIINSDFEFDKNTDVEPFILSELNINKTITLQRINKLFINKFNDIKIVMGILISLSHFEKEQVTPNCETMALAALAHEDLEVKECGVRVFESFGDKESIKLLETVDTNIPWFQDYIKSVIRDLKQKYAIS